MEKEFEGLARMEDVGLVLDILAPDLKEQALLMLSDRFEIQKDQSHAPGCYCRIDMKLMGLNDYVRLCRGNRFNANKTVRQTESSISAFLKPLKKFESPVFILFTWHEKDVRRDADNIIFAKKFILDAMVRNGILVDDRRKFVRCFQDIVVTDDDYYIEVDIRELPPLPARKARKKAA